MAHSCLQVVLSCLWVEQVVMQSEMLWNAMASKVATLHAQADRYRENYHALLRAVDPRARSPFVKSCMVKIVLQVGGAAPTPTKRLLPNEKFVCGICLQKLSAPPLTTAKRRGLSDGHSGCRLCTPCAVASSDCPRGAVTLGIGAFWVVLESSGGAFNTMWCYAHCA